MRLKSIPGAGLTPGVTSLPQPIATTPSAQLRVRKGPQRWPARQRAIPASVEQQFAGRKADEVGVLVLVRHGQSQWNLEKRFTGWTDVPLTARGKLEAREAGRLLSDFQFDQAYTSKLSRAQDTLSIILEEIDQKALPIEESEKLNERHYGIFQGHSKPGMVEKLGEAYIHHIRRSWEGQPPGGESLKQCAERTIPYLQDKILADVAAGKNVLVVAHGNSLRSIVKHLEQLSGEKISQVNLATGVPIVYDFDANMAVKAKEILAERAPSAWAA